MRFAGRIALGIGVGLAALPVASPSPAEADVLDLHAPRQLAFEANLGQVGGPARFVARRPGFTAFLTATETVMVFYQPPLAPARDSPLETGAGEAGEGRRGAVLRMKIVGGTPAPRITGLDQLLGKVNYFIGPDPKRWRTNVPRYSRVRYQGVYPGIDLVYYGNQRQLEHDFIVAPGADPRAITLAFEGADRLELDGNGDLVIHMAGGEVRQKKPLVYQERGGVPEAIPGGYVLRGPREVGFEVAVSYDTERALVIDPELAPCCSTPPTSAALARSVKRTSFTSGPGSRSIPPGART